jgi:hypothetical protein
MQNREDRKKQLIAQGAVYRADVMLAKHEVAAGLRPESIAKSALQQALLIGFAAFKARNLAGLPGLNLQMILPLAMGGISALWKNKRLLKIVLRGAIVVGGVAGAVRLFSKKRETAGDAAQPAFGEPEI